MTSRSFISFGAAAAWGLFAASASAQTTPSATLVPHSEIMTAFQGLGALPDQQVRVVDIGGGVNVAVGILRRESTSTEEEAGVSAIVHHNITEVYYVVSGAGILVTSGDAEGDREVPANTAIVREIVGPSGSRTIRNGETMTIATGDVVVIPAGVAHGFSHVLDQITYLSIRVDPDQVLPAGYKHPLIR